MSYIGNQLTSVPHIVDLYNGNGSTTAFGTLSRSPAGTAAIAVFVNGSYQVPGIDYTLNGAVITFTVAPSVGTNNVAIHHLGNGTSTQAPSDGSVTGNKIATTAVSGNNIVANAIRGNNIVAGTITGNLIADGAISGNNIVANAIRGNNIVAGTITSNLISDFTITSEKLANTINISSVSSNHLSTNTINVVSVSSNHFAFGQRSGNVTVNVAQSNYFSVNTTNSCTWTFTGAPDSSKAVGFILEITSGGGNGVNVFTQTWPTSVRWPFGFAPTLSYGASNTDVLVFITDDGGTNWRGVASQIDSR